MVLKILVLGVLSYPFSRYFMYKGMTLDLTMPSNTKRYNQLKTIFKIPIFNVLFMFFYLCYMLHKFKRV